MMRKEDDIFYDVLFDFLKELPEDFDRNLTTYAECDKIIKNFMVKHGLFEITTDSRKNNGMEIST